MLKMISLNPPNAEGLLCSTSTFQRRLLARGLLEPLLILEYARVGHGVQQLVVPGCQRLEFVQHGIAVNAHHPLIINEGLAPSRSTTSRSARVATSTCRSSGSRVVNRCNHSPSSITGRSQRCRPPARMTS